MRNTIRFGSFFGIPVRIHFTFPLILLAFGIEGGVRGGFQEAVWAVLLVLAVFVCVVLHEYGHSFQARRYGIRVRDIVLLPIGGVARAEKIPEDPKQEIVVAISGPLVNYALALLFMGVIWARQSTLDFENDFVVNLLAINVVLGTFNLIPAFPMDGGRILRGLLALRMSYLTATRYAKNVGQVIAILFVLIGFVNTQFIMLPLIAVFIFFGAISEERMVRIKVHLEGKQARDFVRIDTPTLAEDDTVESVFPFLTDSSLLVFPVGDAEGRLVGVVEAADLKGVRDSGSPSGLVRDHVRTGFPAIKDDTPAPQMYQFMRSHRHRFAAVIAQDETLAGVVTMDDLKKVIRDRRMP